MEKAKVVMKFTDGTTIRRWYNRYESAVTEVEKNKIASCNNDNNKWLEI